MKTLGSLLSSLAMLVVLGLSGCNTTQGVGEDIEEAGDAIEDAARDAKS